jgi:NADPH:quinone reductase-like Zn-dependent oxidoreductase
MTRAIVVAKNEPTALLEVDDDFLRQGAGPGDVVVDVEWSSVNYKDGMAMTGDPGVARISPLIPGIDLVGTIAVADAEGRFAVGDRVVLNGSGIGETRHGGLAERAVVSTGRPEQADFLRSLGAADVVDRATLGEAGKPLQRPRWAGAVDSVGSHTLANVLAQTQWGGSVTACGLAQGSDLPTTVLPFILRGVSLRGINSVDAPLGLRETAWARLASDLDLDLLDSLTTTVGLGDVTGVAEPILAGTVRGRTVVDVRR